MPTIHEDFNHADADIVIESSDGVQFHLHRKNLESNTGAFPGAEFESRDEVVHLTEPAKILGLLFKFVYPKRYPDLEDLPFELLLELAEAVGKYEVASAMYPCIYNLKRFGKEHPMDVFLHAIKHNYDKLADEVACHLVFSDVLVNKLPSGYIAPWIRFREACRISSHEAAKDFMKSLNVANQLEKIESFDALRTAVDTYAEFPTAVLPCATCQPVGRPIYAEHVVRIYKEGIDTAKKFSEFL